MATKRNTTPKVSNTKPKKGKCIECAHAYVMSDGQPCNPLISLCQKNGERYPQSWEYLISGFVQRTGELEIHPMIYLNRK